MKVILLQDVAKIGRRGSIVEIPDGYALNQLIPKKMAEPATAVNKKRIEKLQAELAAGKEADLARFEETKKALQATKIVVSTEANEQGHLFKAVSIKDIVAAADLSGIKVDASMVLIEAPIKELGEQTIHLVQGDAKADIIIEVAKK